MPCIFPTSAHLDKQSSKPLKSTGTIMDNYNGFIVVSLLSPLSNTMYATVNNAFFF